MALEDGSPQSTTSTTEKPEEPDSENVVAEHGAKEDAEQNAGQENPDGKKEEAPPGDKSLGWTKLLFIWIGLWFSVFLYSLVSLGWPAVTTPYPVMPAS